MQIKNRNRYWNKQKLKQSRMLVSTRLLRLTSLSTQRGRNVRRDSHDVRPGGRSSHFNSNACNVYPRRTASSWTLGAYEVVGLVQYFRTLLESIEEEEVSAWQARVTDLLFQSTRRSSSSFRWVSKEKRWVTIQKSGQRMTRTWILLLMTSLLRSILALSLKRWLIVSNPFTCSTQAT